MEEGTCTKAKKVKPLTLEQLKKNISVIKPLNLKKIDRIECSTKFYNKIREEINEEIAQELGVPRGLLWLGKICGLPAVEKPNQKEPYRIIRRGKNECGNKSSCYR